MQLFAKEGSAALKGYVRSQSNTDSVLWLIEKSKTTSRFFSFMGKHLVVYTTNGFLQENGWKKKSAKYEIISRYLCTSKPFALRLIWQRITCIADKIFVWLFIWLHIVIFCFCKLPTFHPKFSRLKKEHIITYSLLLLTWILKFYLHQNNDLLGSWDICFLFISVFPHNYPSSFHCTRERYGIFHHIH